MDRRILIFLATVALLIAGIAIYQANLPPKLNGVVFDPPKAMPDFTLQSVNGPVSLKDFKGKVVVIFFGFTHCEDVCPITLGSLRQVLDNLGDNAKKVQVVFISVDYKRDTPEVVSGYTTNFRSDFVGLTGSQTQIDVVTRDYGIYYKLGEPDADGNYEVEHTSTVQVLNPNGELVMTWPYGIQPNEMASDLKVLIGR